MRIKQINPNAWYDIPGYGGKYQINYFGNIRRALKNGRYKDLHPYTKSSNGRRAVKLNCKEVVVMKLMQITFIGELRTRLCDVSQEWDSDGRCTEQYRNHHSFGTRKDDRDVE